MLVNRGKANLDQLDAINVKLAKEQSRWNFISIVISAVHYIYTYSYLCVKAINRVISAGDFVMCISAIETFTQNCLNLFILNNRKFIRKLTL